MKTEEQILEEWLMSTDRFPPTRAMLIDLIQSAQSAQRERDAEIARTYEPFLLLPELMPQQLQDEIAKAIEQQHNAKISREEK